MVKICIRCYEVNAGGFVCHICGGKLVHTDEPEARELPESVWKSQRVDYGARRGMIIRFLAIIIGSGLGLWGTRRSMALDPPWMYVGIAASLLIGFAVWKWMHVGADRGVRIWVLHKGKLRKARLARAMINSFLPRRKRSRARRNAT